MKLNVVKNAKRNIIFGIGNKIIIMVCPFIERTFIQYFLGANYLGLNSLFTSILSVLSLAEMGFSSAVVYNMYKPAAEGDIPKVNALLNFYKKAYRIIGITVLILGSCVIPFLPSLINGDYPNDINIYFLYCIFLANTVVSYFLFAYMSSLIVVYQRDDINSTINSITKILLTVAQIAILQMTHNYYLFAVMMPVFTVVNNIWIAVVVKKQFPHFKTSGKIDATLAKDIRKLVAGTFIQKACAVTRNSLDSICVSAFLGLTLTAIYNNYYQIVYAITAFLTIGSTAIIGGIGNHVATRSKNQNYFELRNIDFIYMNLSSWCAACLLCLLQPFMTIWMGRDMLLPFPSIVLFCVYFYILKMGDMRSMYSTTNGLWWHHRYRSIAETIMNLLLNIILGKFFGINGIICATAISLLMCNFFWGSRITFNLAFDRTKVVDYYLYHLRYALLGIVVCAITYGCCILLPSCNVFLSLLFRMGVCVIVPPVIYYFVYRKSSSYKYAIKKLLPEKGHINEKTSEGTEK